MNSQDNNFYHFNVENRWPDFKLHEMEIAADGALQLRALPRFAAAAPLDLAKLPIPAGPAGIARLPDGTLFLSDPAANRILMIVACDQSQTPRAVPCLGGEGLLPTQFRQPRGLLYVSGRGLFVADSGNHRIQIFSPEKFQLLEVWGTTDALGEPIAGLFEQPVALAADSAGNVYVLSLAGKLAQKLDPLGRLDDSFWQNVAHHQVLAQPVAIAVAVVRGEERVFILDAGCRKVYAFTLDGQACFVSTKQELPKPMGLAVTEKAIYVGDNQQRAIRQFDHDGKLIGQAVGYQGPVAALVLEDKEHLLVHTGDTAKWARLTIDAGYLRRGFFWTGPVVHQDRAVQWHRLVAATAGLSERAHLKLFIRTSETPLVIEDNDDADIFFAGWREFPRDVNDVFIDREKKKYLWLGGLLTGDGTATPRISQIRSHFDHETWLRYLPAIYREDSAAREFLLPFLSLFESFFSEFADQITHLAARFDPAATPAEFLSWLAGWLAVHLEEAWPEEKKRRVIAEAFQNDAWRGTAHGLRQSLEIYAGIKAHVEEPILHLNLWSLGATSTLGIDTMLASAHPQGAVVGTTATLDQSHLIAGEQYGAPLFEAVTHQFLVLVYRRDVNTPEKLAAIRRIVERDKPAHTAYHLCIVDPNLRLGLQSRVGIDTVVAGPPAAMRLNEELLAVGALAGTPAGKLGEHSQIGVTTRLE